MSELLVVLTDVHGFADVVGNVVDYYGNEVQFLFNGDSVDRGPKTKETLEIIKNLGENATLNLGNHCWALLGALTDADPERREAWLQETWAPPSPKRRLESNTFKSYGIDHYLRIEDKAKALRETMQELGHLSLLESGRLYYEDEQMLVVHAGTDNDQTWQAQRRQLDASEALAKARIYIDEPAQIFHTPLCNVTQAPKDIVHKTLVTGHSHDRSPANARILTRPGEDRPARIRLASSLQKGDPLFAYETWNHNIRTFEQ